MSTRADERTSQWIKHWQRDIWADFIKDLNPSIDEALRCPWSHRSVLFSRSAKHRHKCLVGEKNSERFNILYDKRKIITPKKSTSSLSCRSTQQHLFVFQCRVLFYGNWTYNYELPKCLLPFVFSMTGCFNESLQGNVTASHAIRDAWFRARDQRSSREDFLATYNARKTRISKRCRRVWLDRADCLHTRATLAATQRCKGTPANWSQHSSGIRGPIKGEQRRILRSSARPKRRRRLSGTLFLNRCRDCNACNLVSLNRSKSNFP